MRVLPAVLVSAALALTALPAAALTRTIYVPVADCYVTVEVNDVFVAASSRGVRVERWGENEVKSNC